jgi:N-acetylglucosamine-6-sulfatase
MRRREFLAASALAAAQPARPNVVFVLVDDLRFDELGCTGHPFAQTPNCDRLAREGANFRNAFAATPLCSPSRATFLTGQYPHQHGIVDNTDRSRQSHSLITWPRKLHDRGYHTGFFGKWHMGNDDSPRPGFDDWVSFPGQGECVDPVLNVNGASAPRKGYITDLLSDHAVAFLEQKSDDKPFCLYLSHKAIHPNVQQLADGSVVGGVDSAESFVPAPRHRSLYADAKIPRRGNYGVTPKNKPALERNLDLARPTDDATILNRARMMKAIDEGLGRILAALEETRQLDNTMVIFTSDHGYYYGEHGLGAERRLAYEEGIRIPLLARYPRRWKPGTQPTGFVSSVDLAGWCLSPEAAWKPRGHVYIEYFSDTVFPRIRNMGYRAVRTDRWKYIEYRELKNAGELYDLQRDPFELDNRIGDPKAPLSEMKRLLNGSHQTR